LRGDAYRLTGDYDKAIADFSRAIQLRPDYAGAWGCRAEAYRLAGEQEKAEADMAEWRRLKPDCSDSPGTIGILESSIGHDKIDLNVIVKSIADELNGQVEQIEDEQIIDIDTDEGLKEFQDWLKNGP
jgi:tetratricopeptide (TPR) repeat protein